MSDLGKVAMITGGATGIGRASCLRLAQRGVGEIHVGYATSKGAALEVCEQLEALGAHAHPLHIDVSDLDGVGRAVQQVRSVSEGLDILVNNAGATVAAPFADLHAISSETWTKLWQVNVLGAFWVSQAAAPMLKERSGAIVNVASIAGSRAVGSSLPYGVTKAALLQMSRALAIALAPRVRVNSVSPGTVTTGWHERLIGAEAAQRNAAAEAPRIPMGRVAAADDIAEAIATFALNLHFVTGQELIVDGGKALLY